MAESSWIEIGKIVGAHGLKGELRVYPDSDFPERFEQPGERWLLQPNESDPKPIQLLSGRFVENKGIYIIRLAGVNYRDQAEALRDCKLVVSESDRLPLEEDEYHILDLIGLAVYDQITQALIGTVVSVIPAGNDLLEVERSAAADPDRDALPKRTLIPFVKAIVPIVDLENQRIEITPPAGLLD
ncbi:MAG: ribosome maturation factor RimM [Synechococcales cyanobacterium T60_A2020_003]|nr:ribosome maturation factor RimM [Synechococcales cyanobacterium T60_A2020_003]